MRATELGVLALAALIVGPFLVGSASAATVEQTLTISQSVFHLGDASGPASPTITIAPGDTLNLTIRNEDPLFHTFTFPHFGFDVPIENGSVANATIVTVSIRTNTTDTGRWQFWCRPHSGGPDDGNHTGMVGWVQFQGPTPPRTPGFEVIAAIGALATAFVAVAVWRRRP